MWCGNHATTIPHEVMAQSPNQMSFLEQIMTYHSPTQSTLSSKHITSTIDSSRLINAGQGGYDGGSKSSLPAILPKGLASTQPQQNLALPSMGFPANILVTFINPNQPTVLIQTKPLKTTNTYNLGLNPYVNNLPLPLNSNTGYLNTACPHCNCTCKTVNCVSSVNIAKQIANSNFSLPTDNTTVDYEQVNALLTDIEKETATLMRTPNSKQLESSKINPLNYSKNVDMKGRIKSKGLLQVLDEVSAQGSRWPVILYRSSTYVVMMTLCAILQ